MSYSSPTRGEVEATDGRGAAGHAADAGNGPGWTSHLQNEGDQRRDSRGAARGTSKRKLRTAQATKAVAEGAAVPTKTRVLQQRANTDAARQKAQAVHNQRVDADRTRRTVLAELKEAHDKDLDTVKIQDLRAKMARAAQGMSEIDRRRFQALAKKAAGRVQKTRFGMRLFADPAAEQELNALIRKVRPQRRQQRHEWNGHDHAEASAGWCGRRRLEGHHRRD